jgi:hypothetical protein
MAMVESFILQIRRKPRAVQYEITSNYLEMREVRLVQFIAALPSLYTRAFQLHRV